MPIFVGEQQRRGVVERTVAEIGDDQFHRREKRGRGRKGMTTTYWEFRNKLRESTLLQEVADEVLEELETITP